MRIALILGMVMGLGVLGLVGYPIYIIPAYWERTDRCHQMGGRMVRAGDDGGNFCVKVLLEGK